MHIPSPIAWNPDKSIRILDQTLLPGAETYRDLVSVEDVAEAIRTLRVRGAPLIGIAAAMGVALAARNRRDRGAGPEPTSRGAAGQVGLQEIRDATIRLGATRPTAVNLHWALDRMSSRAEQACAAGEDLFQALVTEANAIWDEDRAMCKRIGELGAPLIPDAATVCTVCNAGALATGGIGTALAPIYATHLAGRRPHVVVPETRPLLQGSRLTAWELTKAGVPCTLIGDGMIASRLRLGDVSCVIVGADRIAANGDVANKIGTYGLALAAHAHGIPFYVAAPSSTLDVATPNGAAIPIEQRESDEVASWQGTRTAPLGVGVWNPAFDMTPAKLITGIITDRGVFKPDQIRHSLSDPSDGLRQGSSLRSG
ncbi:MAG TPA: S-methyl-5-thioribose-1-phosphate isomerase [Gemmatimonadales bacterium]|nr:S-methyl-5-thioribose-1-phosphate isomerase [Gemmatimonadales bacterium]